MIIAIDFDGTIVDIKYPKIGKLIVGAKKYINKLYDDGHTIIIWTCRCRTLEQDAIDFLQKNKIKFHYINMQPPDRNEEYWNDTRKVYADVYIDDNQVGGLPSWKEIYEMI